MAYTRAWDESAPATADNISDGAGEIRNEKVDIRERIEDLLDHTGTRDFDTDPQAPGVASVDTAALVAGAATAVGRAVTYYDSASITGDVSHPGPDETTWETVTGLSLTIPGTVLASSGVLERTNGAAITTSDYIIFFLVRLSVSLGPSSGLGGQHGLLRLYNTTDGVVVGPLSGSYVRTRPKDNIAIGGNDRENIVFFGVDTGRTAATDYEVQFSATVDDLTVTVEAGEAGAELMAIVFKR